jgi:ABC-2 type transport system ATP-binding protein
VLFLDEPTRSLDPIAADELRTHVVDHIIGELGRTVLLATHTLSEAEAVCHRIGIVRRGRLVALGTMDELRRQMTLSNVVELALDGASADLAGQLDRIPGVGGVTEDHDGEHPRLRVDFDGRPGILDEILRTLVASGVRVHAVSTRPPTLEDVYRAAHADGTTEAA